MEDPIAGFDVESAIANLGREALRLGAIPSLGCDPSDLYDVSFRHIVLHGLPHEVASFDPREIGAGPRYRPAERCPNSPCRLGGVCFALHELLQYKRETGSRRSQAIIATMNAAYELWRLLREQILKCGPLVRELDETSRELHEWEQEHGALGMLHNHQLTCILPREALKHSVEVLRVLKTLDDKLPGLIETSELSQAPVPNRRALLLTAVAQHLRWGGITHKEIAQLVPDGMREDGGERVRQRARATDARTLVPGDVAECDPVNAAAGSSYG